MTYFKPIYKVGLQKFLTQAARRLENTAKAMKKATIEPRCFTKRLATASLRIDEFGEELR